MERNDPEWQVFSRVIADSDRSWTNVHRLEDLVAGSPVDLESFCPVIETESEIQSLKRGTCDLFESRPAASSLPGVVRIVQLSEDLGMFDQHVAVRRDLARLSARRELYALVWLRRCRGERARTEGEISDESTKRRSDGRKGKKRRSRDFARPRPWVLARVASP